VAACLLAPSAFADDTVMPAFRLPERGTGPFQPVPLASFASDAVDGELDPAGTRVVYSGSQKDAFQIWIRDLETGTPEAITDDPALDTMPSWSPDGERVVFVSMRADVKGDLYLWEGGDPKPLTDRQFADLYPTFSPDGRSIYFVQGRRMRTRIARLDLERLESEGVGGEGVVTPVTDWGASHPSVSPDGQTLAYTRIPDAIRAQEPARIEAVRIQPQADGTIRFGTPRVLVSEPDPVGFPDFHPDGRTLLYTHFMPERAEVTLDQDAPGSVWAITLGAPESARPLTYEDGQHLFARGHARGVVLTRGVDDHFDVVLIPQEGVLPQARDSQSLVQLAREIGDPERRAFTLGRLVRFEADAAVRDGLWEAVRIYVDRDMPRYANRIATWLEGRTGGDENAERARCEAAIADASAAESESGATSIDRAVAEEAERRLQAAEAATTTRAGRARCALRRGDVLRWSGKRADAARAYQAVRADFADVTDVVALAEVRLPLVLGSFVTAEARAHQALSVQDRWAGRGPALEEARRASTRTALSIVRARKDPERELRVLRELIDAHPRSRQFIAQALMRIGKIHGDRGRDALAARAYLDVTRRFGDIQPESVLAATRGSQYIRTHVKALRAAGRFNEASAIYDETLQALQGVLSEYPPHHRLHRHARRKYLQTALERGGEAERDGDLEKAWKIYGELIAFDDRQLAAHRKQAALSLQFDAPGVDPGADGEPPDTARRRRWAALQRQWADRLGRDPDDAIAQYMRGYVLTWHPDLDEGVIDDAVEALTRAGELDPLSPFPHHSLGWCYLAYEQIVGNVKQPWVLMAIKSFQSAYALNDRHVDLQTEADILLNWANAYAELGNGWQAAYERYRERGKLVQEGVTWLDPEREAMFRYRYGRAAFMVDAWTEAERQYEIAAAIARRRLEEAPALEKAYRGLETLLVGQRALLYHVTGAYDRSNALFEQVRVHARESGHPELLAGLTRSIAHNNLEKGDFVAAGQGFEEAAKLLDEHGAPEIPNYIRIPITPFDSLFPLGFGKASEEHVQTGLMELLYRRRRAPGHAHARLQAAIRQVRGLYDEDEWPDMARALWILEERAALDALAAGDRAQFERLGADIYKQAVGLQYDPGRPIDSQFQGLPEMFGIMVGILTNRGERMLWDLEAGRVVPDETLIEHVKRLDDMEGWRALQESGGLNLIPDEEQRLKYLNATAAIFIERAHRMLTDPEAPTSNVGDAVGHWQQAGGYFVRAIALLQQAVARTAEEPEDTFAPGPDLTAVPPTTRARWHVQSLLALADIASYPIAPGRTDRDRGMSLLEDAWEVCDPAAREDDDEVPFPVALDLGAACWLVKAEIAARRGDGAALDAVVGEYVSTWPGLLGEAYRTHAPSVRARIFRPAMRQALADGRMERVFELAELMDRKAVTDALAAYPIQAPAEPLQLVITRIRDWEAYHARALLHRSRPDDATRAAAVDALTLARDPRLWAQISTAAGRISPEVRDLLFPGPFPWDEAAAAIGPDALAFSAVPVGDQVVLFALGADARGRPALKHAIAPRPASEIRALAAGGTENAAAFVAALGEVPGRWLSGAKVVYLDLQRLAGEAPVEAFAAQYAPAARVVVSPGVQTVVDAWRVKNTFFRRGLVMASDDLKQDAMLGVGLSEAEARVALGKLDGWTLFHGERVEREPMLYEMRTAGLQVWAQPVRVETDGLANVAVAMHGEVSGLGDLRFPELLGEQLRASVVVLPAVRLGVDRRASEMMLTRYLHAMGVPTVALGQTGPLREPVAAWLEAIGPTLGQKRAADALDASPRPVVPRPGKHGEDAEGRGIKLTDQVRVFGWVGEGPGAESRGLLARVQGEVAEAQAYLEGERWTGAAVRLEAALSLVSNATTDELPDRASWLASIREELAATYVELGQHERAIRVQTVLVETLREADAAGSFEAKQRLGQAWYTLVTLLAGRTGEGEDARTASGESKVFLDWLKATRDAEQDPRTKEEWTEAYIQTMELTARTLEREGENLEAFGVYANALTQAQGAMKDIPSMEASAVLYAAEAARLGRETIGEPGQARTLLQYALDRIEKVRPAPMDGVVARLQEIESEMVVQRDPDALDALAEEQYILEQQVILSELRAETRAAALTERAALRMALGDPQGALRAAVEGLEQAVTDDRGVRAWRVAVDALVALGRFDEASVLAEEAFRMRPESPIDRPRFEVWGLLAKVAVARASGDRDAAETALADATTRAERAGDPNLLAEVYRSEARLALTLGQLARAVDRFNGAAKFAASTGATVPAQLDRVGEARTLRWMGESERAGRQLDAILSEKPAPQVTAHAALERARVALDLGDRAAASGFAEQGLAVAKKMSRPEVHWQLLFVSAMATEDGRARRRALEHAMTLIERIGPRLARHRAVEPEADRPRAVYDALVDLHVQDGDALSALGVVERWRARRFLDLVGSAPLGARGDQTIAYEMAMTDWREAQSMAERRGKSAGQPVVDAVHAARDALKGLTPDLPGYLAVEVAPPQDLLRAVPGGQAVLTWHVLPDRVVTFVLQDGRLAMRAVEVERSEVTQTAETLRQSLIEFHNVQASARRLYDVLFAPVADGLPERLIVVPGHPLHTIPVAALHDGQRWLVERFTLSTLPSVDHLRFAQPVGRLTPRRPLAVNWSGMDELTRPPPGTRRFLIQMERWRALARRWPALHFATREADAFAEVWRRARLLRGPEASRTAFLTEAPAADLLHIATHAEFDPHHPLRTHLQLGGVTEGRLFPNFAEERVTPLDILRIELDADLVVLSGCDTGRSAAVDGDGVLGLHRAFLTAGARSVISSLWRVDDLTTGVLMKNLHRGLREADPAASLRAAQRRVLARWPHPAHWAGFRLEGVSAPAEATAGR
jgi:CHAT domain-containing protein